MTDLSIPPTIVQEFGDYKLKVSMTPRGSKFKYEVSLISKDPDITLSITESWESKRSTYPWSRRAQNLIEVFRSVQEKVRADKYGQSEPPSPV